MKWVIEITNNRTGKEVKASNYFHENIEDLLNVQNIVEREIAKLTAEGCSFLLKVFIMYDSGIQESLKPLPEWIIKILSIKSTYAKLGNTTVWVKEIKE